jgi:hypothetical protein
MSIQSLFAKELMDTAPAVFELMAVAPEKVAAPKSASGSTPPDHGASTIHSAELRLALAHDLVT